MNEAQTGSSDGLTTADIEIAGRMPLDAPIKGSTSDGLADRSILGETKSLEGCIDP